MGSSLQCVSAERVMHSHSLLLPITVYLQLNLQLCCAGSSEGLLCVKGFCLYVHQTMWLRLQPPGEQGNRESK